jgi:hypothetical protein
MNAPIVIAPVRKSARVKAPVARAFDVFTSGLSRWWPLDHGVGKKPIAKVDVSKCFAGSLKASMPDELFHENDPIPNVCRSGMCSGRR